MIKLIKNFRQDESGATAIEYGLIAALVSVAAIGALGSLGDSLGTMFESVSGKLSGAVASGTTGGGTGGTGGCTEAGAFDGIIFGARGQAERGGGGQCHLFGPGDHRHSPEARACLKHTGRMIDGS